jgi:membrane complex biogenesis BtpA family protein
MIHLPPLPGAANYDGKPVRDLRERAVAEAKLLRDAGIRQVMVQNTHDRPSVPRVGPATVAAMTAVVAGVAEAFGGELGVNVHKNDAEAGLAVAHACGASFVRVKVLVGAVVGPEGIIQGVAEAAQRLRAQLDHGIEIWADLYELTSWPIAPTPVEHLADLNARFGGADRLIVTDRRVEDSIAAVAAARSATSRPVLIGGRTDATTIRRALDASDGVIVGSCLRRHGDTAEPIDPARLDRFMAAARGAVEATA